MSTRYKILKDLGRGAMGEVVLATDTKLSRKVALKFLAAHVESDREYVDRIMREARIAADLNHPNIVHIYDFGEFHDEAKPGSYDGRTYISMEFIEGKSLKALLRESEKLSNKVILKISLQIAEALAYAHKRNVFHRDIKPENILITTEGQVKLLDFGLAKSASVSTMTKEQVLGTPYYMSPEQAEGDHDIDYRTDIFSFGIVLYELITHERPFHGDTFDVVKHSIQSKEPAPLAQFNSDAPKGFQKIVDKCIAKKREERYQSASEIVKALKREERIVEPFDGLTVRMDDASPKEWKESLVNEAKTLRKRKETEEVKRLLSTGQRRYAKGKYQAAVDSFKEVIAIDPDHREAIEYIEKIRKTLEHKELVDKFLADATFYYSKKKYEQATELYERVLKIDPQNKVAKKGLARGERALGHGGARSLPWLLPRILLIVLGLAVTWLVADHFRGSKTTSPPDTTDQSMVNKGSAGVAADMDLDALSPDVRQQKESAMGARERMLKEKDAAVNVQAPSYADVSFKQALTKELSADRELKSSDIEDLTAAEQHYREATELFSRSITESQQRQKEQVDNALAQGDAEAEKQEMQNQKRSVPASARNSNTTYRQGQRAEANGDAQYKKGEFASALQFYRQASASYSKAGEEVEAALAAAERARQSKASRREIQEQEARRRETETLKTADSAQEEFARRIREIGEAGWQQNTEFAEVKSLSDRAAEAYNSRDFDQAADLYRKAIAGVGDIIGARERYRQALNEVLAQDKKAIEALIEDFKLSLESRNFNALRTILPFDKEQEKVWSALLKVADNPKADLTHRSPAISNDRATVDIHGMLNYHNKSVNSDSQLEINQRWILSKAGGNWRVTSFQGK